MRECVCILDCICVCVCLCVCVYVRVCSCASVGFLVCMLSCVCVGACLCSCVSTIVAGETPLARETSKIRLVVSNGIEVCRVLPISAKHGKR